LSDEVPVETPPPTAHPHSRLRRVLFGLGVPLLLVLGGEIAVRVADPDPPSTLLRAPLERMFMVVTPEFFHDDDHLFWTLKRNLDVEFEYLGDRTDDLGLRNLKTPGAKGDEERIVCVGDSCTYGLGVRIEEAWPTLVGEQTGLDVVNAGVPGYTTFQAVRQWDTLLDGLDPDGIVIEFANNDLAPWPVREDGDWVFATDRERSRHVAFHTAPPLGSRLIQWLAGLAWLPRPERHLATAPLEVRISSRPRVPLDEFRDNLEFLASRAPRAVFLVWPQRVQVEPAPAPAVRMHRLREYHRTIRDVAREGGHDLVDVVELFKGSGASADELFVDDVHASALGCRLVADAVAAALRDE
jgi:lysophospholipase L1-like esterase